MKRKEWKRITALAMAALTIAGGLGATVTCYAEESDLVIEEGAKLRVLLPIYDETRKELARILEEKFETEFPEIEIEVEEFIEPDKLRTYNATSDLPDVFFSTSMSDTLSIIEADHALDLTEYVAQDHFLDNYKVSSVVEPWTDGKLYTLPSGADSYYTPRIFVNKDVFEACGVEYPTTFDELLEACKVFKENGITPICSSMIKDGQVVGAMLWQNFAAAEDPQTVLDFYNGEIGFTDERVVSAFEKIEQLADAGAFMDGCVEMDYGANIELFKSKGAAMYFMFTWALPELAADENVDFISWPKMNDEINPSDYQQAWGGPLTGYVVSADTKYPNAAVKVMEFCVEEEAKFLNEAQNTNTAFDTGIAVEADSELMAKHLADYDAAETKLPSLSFIYATVLSDEIGIQGGQLLTGNATAQEVCETLEKVRLEAAE